MMAKNMMRKSLFIIFILIFLSSYTAFYNNHEYIIVATETENNKPAVNFPVIIHYPYDHYGVFFLKYWNAPKSTKSTTDSKGQVKLEISTFYSPHLIVGSTEFSLTKEVIINGEKPFKHSYRDNEENYQKHRDLHGNFKLPEKLYPEVTIKINKNNP